MGDWNGKDAGTKGHKMTHTVITAELSARCEQLKGVAGRLKLLVLFSFAELVRNGKN